MKRVLFTPTFLKELKKVPQINKSDIFRLLLKYPHTNLIICLDSTPNTDFLKCYLFQKKVRSLVLYNKQKNCYIPIAIVKKESKIYNKQKNCYIPIAIVKKESKKGGNITGYNYLELFGKSLEKVMLEIQEKRFEISPDSSS